MRRIDRDRNYDLQLSLGQWAFGRGTRRPVVSWVQGPPGTDSRSVTRHHGSITQLCGRLEYAQLRAYSLYRASFGRPPFRHTDMTICGSQWSEALLVSQYGLSAERTRSLPYPIDLEAFRPDAPVGSPLPLELVWVGRIIPRKRLDLFLSAGAALIAAGHDIRLTVVGGFPFAAGFQRLLEEFPHPERLRYVARLPRDEVGMLLRTAAVLLQPSEEENFGSSVAEALACGTPVVVGPTNGTGDYIGEGGAHFARYDVDAVAAAVAQVLDRIETDPAAIRACARDAALEHLSVTRVVDDLESIFDEVLGG